MSAVGGARCAIWLLPGGDAAVQFALAIASLAEHYRAPGFEPHITLASVATDDLPALRARCAQLAADTRVLRAQPCGLAGEDSFFRHLYVPLAPTRSLTALRSALRAWPAPPDGERPHAGAAVFDPHLSLLYRDPARRDPGGYARCTAELPLAPFALNRLALVQLADDPMDWRNRGSWPLRD